MNLSCSADGFPIPVITWTFQGMIFTGDTVNSTNSTYAESTIVITDLMISQEGSYICQINSAAIVTPRVSEEANLTANSGKIKCNK